MTAIQISGAAVIDLGWKDGRLTALSEYDHLLRRFGQVDMLKLAPGMVMETCRSGGADEIWVLIEGRASLGLTDRRAESPTLDLSLNLDLEADTPQAVLIPFGVAARIETHGDSLLLRVTSHADEHFPGDRLFERTRQG